VNFPSSDSGVVLSSEVDAETKAFVEDMNENWNQRRGSKAKQQDKQQSESNSRSSSSNGSLYSLENMKKDYRLKKQRIHAGLWMKEIEKQEEAKLGDSISGGGDDIEMLLDSCSEYVFLHILCMLFMYYGWIVMVEDPSGPFCEFMYDWLNIWIFLLVLLFGMKSCLNWRGV
jgi:hypothetical protein